METPPVNLLKVRDDALMEAAHKIGLNLIRTEERLQTGFEWLIIVPASVATMESKSGHFQGTTFGMTTLVQDPLDNRCRIVQVMSDVGISFQDSAEDSVADHVNKWVNGVLPPLCRLFGAEHGKIAGKLKLESYTEGDAAMTLWEGFIGQPQFWGNSAIQEKIGDSTLYRLLHPFITDFLDVKEMLWVDIEGEVSAGGERKIEVELDGHEHEGLSAQFSANFDWSGLDQPCKFRQFMVIRPHDTKPLAEAKPVFQQALRENNIDTTPRTKEEPTPVPPKDPKPKFKFPFLRKP